MVVDNGLRVGRPALAPPSQQGRLRGWPQPADGRVERGERKNEGGTVNTAYTDTNQSMQGMQGGQHVSVKE
jgi:hypothetical protein